MQLSNVCKFDFIGVYCVHVNWLLNDNNTMSRNTTVRSFPETFAEQYESLLTELLSNDRRAIVSGLLPRKTVDLSPYNDRLKSLCDSYEIDYIDNYGDFLLASGDIPDSYFMRDKIHLNSYGLKKLLSNINRVHHITSPRQTSLANRRLNESQSGSRRVHVGGTRNYRTRTYSQGRQSRKRFCHICQRDGH